jgi:hypothetical protein
MTVTELSSLQEGDKVYTTCELDTGLTKVVTRAGRDLTVPVLVPRGFFGTVTLANDNGVMVAFPETAELFFCATGEFSSYTNRHLAAL